MVDVSNSKNSITITVESTNKTNSITTTPSAHNNSVTTKSDTSQYWSKQSSLFAVQSQESAQEAKDWANKLGETVNGIEYSAKHYAELANSYIEGFEGVVTNNTNNIIAISNDYINQINNTANEANTTIDTTKTSAITEIYNTKTTAEESLVAKNLEILTGLESAQADKLQELENKGNEVIADVTNISNNSIAKIENTSNNAVNTVNSSLEEYTEITEQLKAESGENARIAKEQAEIATTKANAAAASALVATEQATIATNQAESARLEAIEATEQASNALASSDSAKTSENNAKASESNALASELSANEYKLRCEEIFQRIGTVIKIKGRVDNYDDLPTENNIDGDAYLVGADGLDAYPEYYWFADHWEYLGTSATSLLWGSITGTLANQTDLQTALNSKVGISNAETITGAKTFTQPLKIQNGAGTGSLLIGGDVNAGTVTNGTRKLARVAVPTQTDQNLNAILLGFDSAGDSALHVSNKGMDAVSFGGQTKITDATSPMSIGFCVAKTRNATAASDKIYPLELDSTEARFNVQPNYNGVNLALTSDIPDISGLATKDEIPDLSNYVTNTDYATSGKAGVVKVDIVTGINADSTGKVYIAKATDNLVTTKTNNYRPLVPSNIDLAVKTGVTTNTIELTDEEKKNAQEWLGISSGALNMFDTVLKDHILTYEESKGLALQGTYVYKEAIAGSRYGYPDFYNKCLEEYLNSSNTKQWLKSNVTYVGSVVDSQGVLTGFTTANYATLPKMLEVNQDTESWECQLKLSFSDDTTIGTILDFGFDGVADYRLKLGQSTTNDNITTRHFCFVSHSMGSLGVGVASYGQAEVLANTTYFIRYGFDKTARVIYLDYSLTGEEGSYIRDTAYGVSSMNKKILYAPIIGNDDENNALTTMTVDLNYSYIKIDGKIWWSGTDTLNTNSNGHRFYDIAQKPYIDEIFTSTGRAWMYGVDVENERIFLPRNSKYFRIGDESTVGTNQDAGLPNIEGFLQGGRSSAQGSHQYPSGAFYQLGAGLDTYAAGGTDMYNVYFDASRSSAVYGKAVDTVELDSVNMLLYICVGNTESEEALTDVIDITTTENDTIPLGFSTYQNGTQPSVSWLKSAGQWNDGNVYTTFYNEFVQKIGQAFASGTVVEYTSEYTDYDLVINQTDMTFRLPLLDGSEDLPSDRFENLTLLAAGSTYTAPANGWYNFSLNGTSTKDNFLSITNFETEERDTQISNHQGYISATMQVLKGQTIRVDYRNVSIIANEKRIPRFIYAQGNGSLYFKVANAVQNLELLNVGEVLEAVNDVVPNNRTVWDGQWVQKYLSVMSKVTAVGSYTYDLSEYLPDDGFTYEVMFDSYMNSGNTTYFCIGTQASPYTNKETCFYYCSVSTADGRVQPHQFFLPIDSSRKVYTQIYSAAISTTSHLFAVGYRRIGTNV